MPEIDQNRRVKLKDGYLLHYKKGLLGNKWKEVYAILWSDSTLAWYPDNSSAKPLGSLELNPLAPFLVVGEFTDRICKRPELPPGGWVPYLFAVGTGPNEPLKYFLSLSELEFQSWWSCIKKTLPSPPNVPHHSKSLDYSDENTELLANSQSDSMGSDKQRDAAVRRTSYALGSLGRKSYNFGGIDIAEAVQGAWAYGAGYADDDINFCPPPSNRTRQSRCERILKSISPPSSFDAESSRIYNDDGEQ